MIKFWNDLTGLGKFAVTAILAGILLAGFFAFTHFSPVSSTNQPTTIADRSNAIVAALGGKPSKEINVCVVTWGGYAGGQYFNRGFTPNKESEFTKRYGINVRFTTIDDFAASRNAWKSGKCQLLWVTVDAFTTEAENLTKAGFSPSFLFQVDWSRGGDAIVATSNMKNMGSLRGKKVAVTPGTPSHTFLLRMMSSAGLKAGEVTLVETGGAPDAAKMFQTGSVDAAVVWSPDDEASIKAVPGSRAVVTTKEATHIIADGFIVDKKWAEANRSDIEKLIEGWLIGNAEINTNAQAKAEAVKILATGYNLPPDEAEAAINRVRLVTIGDNRQFFGIDSGASVTGEKLFTQSAALYREYGNTNLVPSIPSWRAYADPSFIAKISPKGPQDAPEGVVATPKVQDPVNAPAIATKMLAVTFETGSAELSEDATVLIIRSFLQDALASQGTMIRIEGNTDSVGSAARNVVLSERRANAVGNYLIKLGVQKDRLVIVGNGPNKPVCREQSETCYAQNRRTEFSLLK